MMTDDKFTYSRDRSGVFESFNIRNPNGQVIASLYFWDEPDTDEAAQAEEAARAICDQLTTWGISDDPVTSLFADENKIPAASNEFATYQLAPDHATYGPDAGKCIVTSADHERELSGPMSEKDAKRFARLLKVLERCATLLADHDEAEGEEGETYREAVAAIAECTGRSA